MICLAGVGTVPATVPATRLIATSPATGAKVPPQVFEILGVAATTKLVGKVSVKSKSVSPMILGLVITSVKVDGLPAGTLVGKKDLAIVGLFTTFKMAVLLPVPAAPVSVEATPPEVLG